jgi:hypothetical protein
MIMVMPFTRTGFHKAMMISTSVLIYLWTMNFHYVAYSVSMISVTAVWVGGTLGKIKRVMNTTLSKCQVLPRHTAYITLKPFLYVDSISEHNK